MMPPTLLVIDMQRQFSASQDPAVKLAVGKLVKKSVAKGWPIVFVEMDGGSQTHAEIFNLANEAKHVIVGKSGNNGCEVVLDVCHRFGFSVDQFVVCGVNTDVCVQSTVRGLINTIDLTEVFVVRDACNTVNRFEWSSFIHNSRIHLTTVDLLDGDL